MTETTEDHTLEHPFRVRPGLCVESEILLRKLKDGKPGDALTDAELSDLCGFDTCPQNHGKGYSNLLTAQGQCESQYGICWQRVTGEGHIRCLASKETDTWVAHHGTRRVRSLSRKMKRKLLTVKPEDLTEDERRGWRARVGMFRLAEVMVTKRTEKKLLPHCGETKVDPKRLLSVLGNGAKGGDDSTE